MRDILRKRRFKSYDGKNYFSFLELFFIKKISEFLYKNSNKRPDLIIEFFENIPEKILNDFDYFLFNKDKSIFNIIKKTSINKDLEKIINDEDELELEKKNFSQAIDELLNSKLGNLIFYIINDKNNISDVLKIEKFIYEKFSSYMNDLINKESEYDDYKFLEDRLSSLKSFFNLTDFENEFIKTIYMKTYFHNKGYCDLMELIINYFDFKEFYSFLLNIEKNEFIKLINSQNIKIFKLKFIEVDDARFERFDFFLDEGITEYLEGLNNLKNLFCKNFNIIERFEECYDINSFGLDKEILRAIIKIVNNKSNCKLFIYGEPGLGKTEFVKSLANYLNFKTIWIFNEKKINQKSNYLIKIFKDEDFQIYNVLNRASYFADEKTIFVIDEADTLLNLSKDIFSNVKSDLNIFLEKFNHRIIFISNECFGIHLSVYDRFDLSVKFKSNFKITDNIINYFISIYDFSKYIKLSDIKKLIEEYNINPSKRTIHKAFDNINNILKSENLSKKEILNYFKLFLFKNYQIDEIKKRKEKKIKDLSENFNLNLINTDININNFIKIFEKNINLLKNEKKFVNFIVLLYGEPGTGKTEFIKFLKEKYKMKLFYYRVSDIFNPLFGLSEMNIKKIFYEASHSKKAILFFDEADSLIMNRKSIGNNSNIYNPIINEFLTQIENFRGICFFATNYVENLDFASLRRFSFKICFKNLKSENLIEAYETFFGKTEYLDDELKNEIKKLEGINIGDFYAVKKSIIYDENYEIIFKKESKKKNMDSKKEIDKKRKNYKKEKDSVNIKKLHIDIISLLKNEIKIKKSRNKNNRVGF